MKAWFCYEKTGECGGTIVFAETRGKAKSIAKGKEPFCDYDLEYTDVNARRMEIMDQFYRGEDGMDWSNPNDRLAMVKYAGFSCADEVFDAYECERCPAMNDCVAYKEYMEEVRSEGGSYYVGC